MVIIDEEFYGKVFGINWDWGRGDSTVMAIDGVSWCGIDWDTCMGWRRLMGSLRISFRMAIQTQKMRNTYNALQ